VSEWADHVAAALLGTQRRPVPPIPEALPETLPATGDSAGRLLDQAALLTVRRRAGWRPGSAEPLAAAPAETTEIVPPDAARRIERILAGEQIRVLGEWLSAAVAAGRRVPARTLPDLLERGRTDRLLRPYIARAGGRRAMWLALQNPDWAYLVGEPATATPMGADMDADTWETGTRGQRLTFLARLRGGDPDAAREALRGTWPTEPAADRAAFLATFEKGLGTRDEEFLEEALDDRAKDVRHVAADLLARLPGSAYGRRMAERARACLSPGRRTVRQREQTWVVVEPPEGGAGALRDLLAHTPLTTWTTLFGLSPMEVVCLPIDDDYARDVHIGWARAAVLQGDAEWARAILKGGVAPEEIDVIVDLLGALPADERDEAAADLLRWAGGYRDLIRILDRVPGPWAGALADAVLSALAEATRTPEGARYAGQLRHLADERLGPPMADRLDELARLHDAWPLTELAETLRFRHDMLKELL
jgi:hypothetical protein